MSAAGRSEGRWLAAWRRRVRRLFGLVPALDLHGLGVNDALAETERFLRAARAAGEPVVRIVYGKGRRSPGGRGVLREVVPHWLENEGRHLVLGFVRQPDQTGADGSVRVSVRPASDVEMPSRPR
jgi:DNA-nicking Smr family endonuclease